MGQKGFFEHLSEVHWSGCHHNEYDKVQYGVFLSLFLLDSPVGHGDIDSPSSSRSPEPENINPFFSEPFAGSDLVLEVEGRQFHVHRAVLRIVSEVFDGMFSSDFVEKDREVLPLPGKKSDDVEKLLRVIYPCFREDIDGEVLDVVFRVTFYKP